MPHPRSARMEKGWRKHTLHQFLHVDLVRYGVARARHVWYVKARHRLRTLDSPAAAANTVSHNLKGVGHVLVDRMLYLIRPLSVLGAVPDGAEILVIGPRSEGELLLLMAHGFQRSRIRAIDLISYSPWVELGDMHDLPYPDGSFDVVIAGWVLAYSDKPGRAADEIVRVLRPGGAVALGVETTHRSDDQIEEEMGYLPGSTSAVRLRSTDGLLALFGNHVDAVLYRDEVPIPESADGDAVVIFRTTDQ